MAAETAHFTVTPFASETSLKVYVSFFMALIPILLVFYIRSTSLSLPAGNCRKAWMERYGEVSNALRDSKGCY